MSESLYVFAGLRFWTQEELNWRKLVKDALIDCVKSTLLDINQMWVFEECETPPMMPLARMSSAYDRADVFILTDPPSGTDIFALRAETTDGSYLYAQHLLKTGKRRMPLCVFQSGYSFRRETNDGATAAKMRFNAFNQLEFQLIFSEDTKADLATPIRSSLREVVRKLTGRKTRLIKSDRLPNYSLETIDIEVEIDAGNWREVASTSRRTDFPVIPGQKPAKVLEIAFGLDRMTILAAD
jgi:glycyl-tRNA synthetase (class II)